MHDRAALPLRIAGFFILAALVGEVEEPRAASSVDHNIRVLPLRIVRGLCSMALQQILRLPPPVCQVTGMEDAETIPGILNQPVRPFPTKDHWSFSACLDSDSCGTPVLQVGGVAHIDFGTIALILVPEPPCAIRLPEEAGIDNAV